MNWESYFSGLTSGALLVLLGVGAFVAYLFRGHRIDLTQVRALNVWEDLNRRKAFGPWRTEPKDRDPSMPEPGEPSAPVTDMLVAGQSHNVNPVQHGQRTTRERGEDE